MNVSSSQPCPTHSDAQGTAMGLEILPLRGHTSSVMSSAKRDLAVYVTREAIEGRWEPWRWPSCCLRELATVLLPRGGCYEVSQLGIAQSCVSWPRYSYKETTGQETLAAVFKHQHPLGLQKPFSDSPVLSSPFKGAPLDTSGNSAAPAPAAAQWLMLRTSREHALHFPWRDF